MIQLALDIFNLLYQKLKKRFQLRETFSFNENCKHPLLMKIHYSQALWEIVKPLITLELMLYIKKTVK